MKYLFTRKLVTITLITGIPYLKFKFSDNFISELVLKELHIS